MYFSLFEACSPRILLQLQIRRTSEAFFSMKKISSNWNELTLG